MSLIVTFTWPCQDDDCDGVARAGIEYLGHNIGDPIEVDIDMDISQMVLTCEECGVQYFTGDIEVYSADEL